MSNQYVIIGKTGLHHNFEIGQVVDLRDTRSEDYVLTGLAGGEYISQYVSKEDVVPKKEYDIERVKQPSSTLCDFYKTSHKPCYPEGMTGLYSMMSCRSDKYSKVKGFNVIFGIQAMIQEYLIEHFNDNFFSRPRWAVIQEYQRVIYHTIINPFDKSVSNVHEVDASHIGALHDLGYLPIKIKAVKEGTILPVKTPFFTIENTHKDFFWLTNYLETIISTQVWGAITSATTAYKYHQVAKRYAWDTVGNFDHVPFQIHDFSMRGMNGLDAAKISGMAHMLFSKGTDTIPAIHALEAYYGADITKEIVGTSIVATEHSIMSSLTPADGNRDETEAYRYLLKNNPSGFMSVVSDTYDFWKVIGEVLPALKDEIMARDGRLVIRPDSGNPVDIVAGKHFENLDYHSYVKSLEDAQEVMKDIIKERVQEETPHGEMGENYPEGEFYYKGKYYRMRLDIFWNRHDKKFYYMDGVSIEKFEEFEPTLEELGLVESLWNIFGGTESSKGYKVLDSHIGVIYGDSITPERAELILERLKAKGFASSNVVFGVGSYTYQFVTRDTHGQAIKATWAEIDDKEVMLFKDPKTDDGTKRSLRGRVAVIKHPLDGSIETIDGLTKLQQDSTMGDLLETVFEDGELKRFQKLSEIRGLLGTE
ncbi:hypothetical protein LC76P1_00026 [Lysinibacillus phage LC76P1]|nr:hypothetical protein LC76P1_00026 [Lysinibacillus phage LC76P1]